MSNYRELLIGCGHSRTKRLFPSPKWKGIPSDIDVTQWQDLITLDINLECDPDIVCDLSCLRSFRIETGQIKRFEVTTHDIRKDRALELIDDYGLRDNLFNEIHAYEVLEHIGQQGKHVLFFQQFSEFWRILKPGGYFCATVPHWQSLWAWGDPSHTRVINEGTLTFLDLREYERQLGKTAMSDYRKELGETNFEVIQAYNQNEMFVFILRAIK